LVAEESPYLILMDNLQLELRKLNLPFGIFFITSFSITVIFYLALYVFMAGGYAIRAFSFLLPTMITEKIIDADLAKRHSVGIVFVVFGVVPSAAISFFH
jgi:hypothetical protein